MEIMNTIGENIYEGIAPAPPGEVQGWNSTSQVFVDLIEETRPSIIIEVGTWFGGSAIHMAHACRRLGLQTRIYCVDTWLGAGEFWNHHAHERTHCLRLKNGYPSVYYDFLANVVGHECQDIIVPIPNTSFIASTIFEYHKIKAELIYIDGSHAYEDVKSDVLCYEKLLQPGGVIFGDDIGWHEVNRAVREIYPQHEVAANFWVKR